MTTFAVVIASSGVKYLKIVISLVKINRENHGFLSHVKINMFYFTFKLNNYCHEIF